MAKMKEREPENSVASWAFCYAGTPEGVLCVLGGMTFMEHLKDNLLSYTPLKPISKEEDKFLMERFLPVWSCSIKPLARSLTGAF